MQNLICYTKNYITLIPFETKLSLIMGIIRPFVHVYSFITIFVVDNK